MPQVDFRLLMSCVKANSMSFGRCAVMTRIWPVTVEERVVRSQPRFYFEIRKTFN